MKTSVEINHADTYNDKTAVEKTTLMKRPENRFGLLHDSFEINHADTTIKPLRKKPRWWNVQKTVSEYSTI